MSQSIDITGARCYLDGPHEPHQIIGSFRGTCAGVGVEDAPAALPTMVSSCVVLASDFSNSLSDPVRERWTGGKLRHLIDALRGEPVVITTDAGNGHTIVGARLHMNLGRPNERVDVEYRVSDDLVQRVNYPMVGIGAAIIPLTQAGHGAKWDALDSYRVERMNAVMAVQKIHGDPEGRSWGTWHASPRGEQGRIVVSYEPYPAATNPADTRSRGNRWWGSIIKGEIFPWQ